jgi:hypothetical protein
MKILQRLMVLSAALVVAGPVFAQAPQGTPTRIRGTVDSLAGDMLMVNARDGQMIHITLAPNYTVRGVVKKQLSDIKPGDYVASTSVKGTDGKLHAIEVHIFPEALRGTAEGQFAWDLVPDSLMTNATVGTITASPKGGLMKVTYKGSESEIDVPADIPIVTYVPGDATLLKKGAAIFVIALKKDDGSYTASGVTAEKDGVKPPM